MRHSSETAPYVWGMNIYVQIYLAGEVLYVDRTPFTEFFASEH